MLDNMDIGTVGMIDGTTLPNLRAESIESFKGGELKFLVNVDVLTTGFDAPNVDMVVLLRPTASPGLYYQMVGRGFRICPGKDSCLVLDFGGNIERHGPVDEIIIKDKSAKSGRESSGEKTDVPVQTCPKCQEIVNVFYRTCPTCGFAFPTDKKPHEETASDAAILSTDIAEPEEFEIEKTECWEHFKKGADPDHPSSLWVKYVVGPGTSVNAWFCFNHPPGSFARDKAVEWWEQRSVFPVPKTVKDAIDLIKRGAVAPTKRIRARLAGKYYQLIDELEFGPIPKTMAEPEPEIKTCAFCVHFSNELNYCNFLQLETDFNQIGCGSFNGDF